MAHRVIHPSLVYAPKFGGAPREYAIYNGAAVVMLVIWAIVSGMVWLALLVAAGGAGVHVAMAKLTKRDHQAMEAYFRYVQYQHYYPARAHPCARVPNHQPLAGK
ncbi:VirB3 family type IV secretion system protein [Ramlibacter alkalitolerans]|uniref:VirB3 family type IV secretion system protein n=1 Tax=Ramlibacter alkalitolerans TaxID=2039631 RepID=A0ABS1JU08_9BURK|nr:VirB3 family type IV secretion system protein [Ramlibacter alkalitolerans]MBL0427780.1 VirB3 family type IV secretion system protein [Ramlibacter alkalitolerans]